MRRVRILVTLAAALAVPAVILAHGTGNKVVGTVTAIHAAMNHVEVKTADGHVVGVKVNDATKYTRTGRAVTFADLKEGSRVVITTTGAGDARTATLVKMSAGASKAAAASPAPPHHH